MRRSPVRVRSLAPENRRFYEKAAVFWCKKLRSSFGHRFYPVIFPSITNSTRTAAKLCPNFLCFFSQQSGFWHQDIIKHFRRSSLRFFHERDLLIIVVVWSANHFRYNGEFFPCLLYSSLEAILLPRHSRGLTLVNQDDSAVRIMRTALSSCLLPSEPSERSHRH